MSTALDKLPDPKIIGAAEYTLVHEYVTEMEEAEMEPVLIRASLDELSRWARKALIEYTRMSNSY